MNFKATFENFLGGVAAAAVTGLAALVYSSLSSNPVSVWINEVVVENPIRGADASKMGDVASFLGRNFPIANTERLLEPIRYAPHLRILDIHVFNDSATSIKKLEVTTPGGVLFAAGKPATEPNSTLVLENLRGKSTSHVWLFAVGQPGSPINLSVVADSVAIENDAFGFPIMPFKLNFWIMRNPYVFTCLAAIGALGLFAILGVIGRRLYRFVDRKYGPFFQIGRASNVSG